MKMSKLERVGGEAATLGWIIDPLWEIKNVQSVSVSGTWSSLNDEIFFRMQS